MANRPAQFRQADVKRAVKGARAAGLDVAKVVVAPDGQISIFIGTDHNDRADAALNEWMTAREG